MLQICQSIFTTLSGSEVQLFLLIYVIALL